MKTIRSLQIFGVLVIVFGLVIFYAERPAGPLENTVQENVTTGTATVMIEGLYQNKSITLSGRESLLAILRSLDATDPSLQLVTKEYSGLGTLVESMHGIRNGTDNKYWQYTVNGIMPQVGADAYIPVPGEVIEWRFSESKQ